MSSLSPVPPSVSSRSKPHSIAPGLAHADPCARWLASERDGSLHCTSPSEHISLTTPVGVIPLARMTLIARSFTPLSVTMVSIAVFLVAIFVISLSEPLLPLVGSGEAPQFQDMPRPAFSRMKKPPEGGRREARNGKGWKRPERQLLETADSPSSWGFPIYGGMSHN